MTTGWRAETKPCAACGRGFQPRSANQRYCGRLCRQRMNDQQHRSRTQQDRRDTPPNEKPDD
jgi:hypothetical protein